MNGTQGRLVDELGTIRVSFDPPPVTQIAAVPEIIRLRAQGLGPTAIARSLNRRRVQTPSGRGRWHPDTVKRHLDPGPWRDYMRRYRAQRQR